MVISSCEGTYVHICTLKLQLHTHTHTKREVGKREGGREKETYTQLLFILTLNL